MTHKQIQTRLLNNLAECQTYFDKSEEALSIDLLMLKGMLSGVSELIVAKSNHTENLILGRLNRTNSVVTPVELFDNFWEKVKPALQKSLNNSEDDPATWEYQHGLVRANKEKFKAYFRIGLSPEMAVSTFFNELND